jgi:hypothetical protein
VFERIRCAAQLLRRLEGSGRLVAWGGDLIHSVDSLELVEEIDRRAQEAGLTESVLFSRLRENYLDTLGFRWSACVAQ